MTLDEAIRALEARATETQREAMTRYNIPNGKALGVPVGEIKRLGRSIGQDNRLARALWADGRYEPRMLASQVGDPALLDRPTMDAWTAEIDNWAICDLICADLFDRTPHAWDCVADWTEDPRLYVKRAGFAMIWSLTIHDKAAADDRFLDALTRIEAAATDARDHVKKAVDMALRAVGKRNQALHAAAVATCDRLAASKDKTAAWIGRHSGRELRSEKVLKRIASR